MKFVRASLLAIALIVLHSQHASATLILTIERISDTEGLLTASGQIDVNVSNSIDGLAFSLLSANNSGPIAVVSEDLQLGDDGFRAIRFRNPFQVLLRMQGSYELGDEFSGQLRFSLSQGNLLDIGTITPIFNNDLPGELYGTVEFVASRTSEISEPGVFGLMTIALLALTRSRQKVQTKK